MWTNGCHPSPPSPRSSCWCWCWCWWYWQWWWWWQWFSFPYEPTVAIHHRLLKAKTMFSDVDRTQPTQQVGVYIISTLLASAENPLQIRRKMRANQIWHNLTGVILLWLTCHCGSISIFKFDTIALKSNWCCTPYAALAPIQEKSMSMDWANFLENVAPIQNTSQGNWHQINFCNVGIRVSWAIYLFSVVMAIPWKWIAPSSAKLWKWVHQCNAKWLLMLLGWTNSGGGGHQYLSHCLSHSRKSIWVEIAKFTQGQV